MSKFFFKDWKSVFFGVRQFFDEAIENQAVISQLPSDAPGVAEDQERHDQDNSKDR